MIIIEFKHNVNQSKVKTIKRTVNDTFNSVNLMKSLGFAVTYFKVIQF